MVSMDKFFKETRLIQNSCCDDRNVAHLNWTRSAAVHQDKITPKTAVCKFLILMF